MTEAQINNDLMALANFYGAIASTPGLSEQIIEKAQRRLMDCLNALDKGADHLIGTSIGLII